jgi:ribose transport system permease protein
MRQARASLAGTSYAWPALIAVLTLLVVNAVASSDFVKPGNWGSLAAVAAPFILLGMAQSLPVIAGRGGMDLSLGPLAGVVNVVIVAWLAPNGLSSPPLLILAVVAIGALGGLVNGVLVAYARIPPIIATLGTFFIYSALALEILPVAGGNIPGWVSGMTQAFGPIPYSLLPILAALVLWTFLASTAYGRNLFSVGGDDRAAHTAGVNVAATRALAYMFGGIVAAIGGLALTAILETGDPTSGEQYTLYSITAVALGGVLLSGGRGGLLGGAAGGAILFLIQNFLTVSGLSSHYIQIGTGVTLILALALNRLGTVVREQRFARTAHGEAAPSFPELLRGTLSRAG